MRFTWGHGILTVIILIVVSFTSILIFSFNKKHDHELMYDDYYARELDHQDIINKIQLTKRENQQIKHQFVPGGIRFTMPEASRRASGQVSLLRPSNSKLDFQEPLTLDSVGVHFIEASKLAKGKYQYTIDWKVNGKEYFQQEMIYVP